MKASDRRILLGIAAFAAIVAFYFLVISPKRAELSDLKADVETAQSDLADQEQAAAAAEQAKTTYHTSYRALVVLGKAVPGDDDISSLLDQVDGLADDSGIRFSSLRLASAGGEAATAPAAPTEPPPTEGAPSEPAPSTDATAVPAGTPAPATESVAAALPLGAAVGPAGLPTMPYDMTFTGGFFDIADFLAGLDSMVKIGPESIGAKGRLLTIDGFSLQPSDKGFPELNANLHVTSYVTPADQGLTAGATPEAPAPSTSTTPTPTSGTDTPAAPVATAAPGVQ